MQPCIKYGNHEKILNYLFHYTCIALRPSDTQGRKNIIVTFFFISCIKRTQTLLFAMRVFVTILPRAVTPWKASKKVIIIFFWD